MKSFLENWSLRAFDTAFFLNIIYRFTVQINNKYTYRFIIKRTYLNKRRIRSQTQLYKRRKKNSETNTIEKRTLFQLFTFPLYNCA